MKMNYMHKALIITAVFLSVVAPIISAVPEADFENDPNMRQVAIEAMIVEISEEQTRNLGLNYTLNRSDELDAEGNNNLSAVDFSFPFKPDSVKVPTFIDSENRVGSSSHLPGIGLSLKGMDIGMGSFTANLRALLSSGKAEVRAHTIAVALNNTQVVIETVDEVPFQDVKYDKHGRSTLDVSYEDVGVKLFAKPVIKDLKKKRLTLDISELNLSSVTGYENLQNVNRPIFATSNAKTKIEITSGETFVLGGLKTKRNVISESGVPFLRRIPILGYFFKSEKKVQENKDIFFFITPYLLQPSSSPILPYNFKHGEFLIIKNTPVTFE